MQDLGEIRVVVEADVVEGDTQARRGWASPRRRRLVDDVDHDRLGLQQRHDPLRGGAHLTDLAQRSGEGREGRERPGGEDEGDRDQVRIEAAARRQERCGRDHRDRGERHDRIARGVLDAGPLPVGDAGSPDAAVLHLDPREHHVLGARREDLAGPLHDVHDVRAELAELIAELLAFVLRAAEQPRRHAPGRDDERQDDEGEYRLDDPQPDLGEHGHDERDHDRGSEVGGEQLQQLDVGHRCAGDVPGPAGEEVRGREHPEAFVELPAQVVQQPEGHDVDDDHLEPSEQGDRQRERDQQPHERLQL